MSFFSRKIALTRKISSLTEVAFSSRKSLRDEIISIKKRLQKGHKQTAGRNNKGRITVWGRGGGHKRVIKQVLFNRNVFKEALCVESYRTLNFIVEDLTYDARRTAFLAFISTKIEGISINEILFFRRRKDVVLKEIAPNQFYFFFYILAPKNLHVGEKIPCAKFLSGQEDDLHITPGKAILAKNVPLGTLVHNIELKKNKGGQLVRAAGVYAQVVEKSAETRKVRIRLPSGQERWILYESCLSIGTLTEKDRSPRVISKAGRSRWLSKRPKVRGVAMNPVDHPHGGGEGKTSGGRPSVTPWGRLTKNFRLRKLRKNPFIILYTDNA